MKFAGMLLAAGAVSPAVMAQTVDLYYGPYAYSVGGEFTAVTTPTLYNGNYASSTLVTLTDPYNNQQVTGFETFCVQTEVDFTPYNWGNSTPYNTSTSLSSVGIPDNFPLSRGAAYLYWQFATGQLQGYDYTDTGTRITDAGVLQSALWALQGDQSYGVFPSGTSGNPFYNDALNALGSSVINEAATSSDNFGVDILNLTSGNNPAQNQLVYTGGGSLTHNQNPAPDRGATLALLALSLAGLAVFARGLGAGQRIA